MLVAVFILVYLVGQRSRTENFELVLTHSQAELLVEKFLFFLSAFCCDTKKTASCSSHPSLRQLLLCKSRACHPHSPALRVVCDGGASVLEAYKANEFPVQLYAARCLQLKH
ncbi:hypothetical protein EYF80_013563 [Liparis tanakae]|uniref:Secreted protein n=1 Tax=Liparis tanakae TaxID=230148 RepID=A0A4Z2IFB3_9TELE|nr:hypothetical protein EYF80_013563 [Liparis tanakae]